MEKSTTTPKTREELLVKGFHRLNAQLGNLPPKKLDPMLRTYAIGDLQLLSRHESTSRASRKRINRIIEQMLIARRDSLSEGPGQLVD